VLKRTREKQCELRRGAGWLSCGGLLIRLSWSYPRIQASLKELVAK
jgi:hypothetical protein